MADVVYNFRSVGAGDVIRTFQKIGDAAERSGRQAEGAMRRAAGRGGGGRSPADREAQDQAKRVRAAERAEAKRAAAFERGQERELRALERRLAKEHQLEQRAEAKRMRMRDQEGRKHSAMMARVHQKRRDRLARIGDGFSSGAAMVGGAAALAGAAAIRQNIGLRDKSIAIATQGGGNAELLEKSIRNAALSAPGASSDAIAGGVETFVSRTGDLDAAQRFSGIMARISVATGTAAEDIGGAMADLFTKFDIKSVSEMEAAMETLAMQGKKGSFELKDAAKEFPRLAASAQRLGLGKGTEALAKLGGLTQIVRGSTGSSEQTTTAISAMFRQLTTRQKELGRSGVSVFKKDGSARDINDVLVDVVSKVGGKDLNKKRVELSKIFGDEGMAGLGPLMTIYADALAQGKDGAEALRAALMDAQDATGAHAQIERDFVAQQQQAGNQLNAAWERLRASLSEFTPIVVKAGNALAGGVESFMNVVKVAADTIGVDLTSTKLSGTAEERVQQGTGMLDNLESQRAGILKGLGLNVDPTASLERIKTEAGGEAIKRIESTADGRMALRSLADLDKQQGAIQSEVDAAQGEIRHSEGIDQQTLTSDQFAKQFAAAGPQFFEGHGEIGARMIAADLAAGRTPDLTGFNDEQQAIAQSFADQKAFERGQRGEGGQVETNDTVVGLNDLTAGLAAAAKAANEAAENLRRAGSTAGRPSAFQD